MVGAQWSLLARLILRPDLGWSCGLDDEAKLALSRITAEMKGGRRVAGLIRGRLQQIKRRFVAMHPVPQRRISSGWETIRS